MKLTVAGDARRSWPAGGSFAYVAHGVDSAHAMCSGRDLEMAEVCPGVSISCGTIYSARRTCGWKGYVRRERRSRAVIWFLVAISYRMGVRQCGGTHRAGVRYDARDVPGGINCRCAVRTLLSDIGVSGDNEGEALAIDDVPVERVDLGSCVASGSARVLGWETIDAREPKTTRQACV